MTEKKQADVKQMVRVLRLAASNPDLFRGSMLALLQKADEPEGRSNQGRLAGRKEHPFNMRVVDEYGDFNPTHAACIETKRSATVGHRHKSKKVYEILDPLCKVGWQDVLDRQCIDYWKAGNGYIECVHGSPKEPDVITGLHHVPSRNSWVTVESTPQRDFHYEVVGHESARRISSTRRFARFGDLESFRARMRTEAAIDLFGGAAKNSASEMIHWPFPNTQSPYYGRPEYFSAVPSIELVQVMTQREFNFYFNNGVPEFLLFILGATLSPKDWDKLEATLRAGQGLQGGHMSAAFNFENPQLKVQLEKLGVDTSGNSTAFLDRSEVTSMNVATAHQVPPLLAGIQIPGKMGGTNEGPNSLSLFQAQKIAPAQKSLSGLLASTLGSGVKFRTKDGGTAVLAAEDFLGKDEDKGNGFQRITDEIDMGQLDTMARMKEPIAGSGRDLSQGLRRNGQDRARTGGKPRTA